MKGEINMKYSKIYKKGNLRGDEFLGFANYVVANHVRPLKGQPPFTLDEMAGIAEVLSMDMATGAEYAKRGYILKGILIGSGLATGIFTYAFLKNKKRE